MAGGQRTRQARSGQAHGEADGPQPESEGPGDPGELVGGRQLVQPTRPEDPGPVVLTTDQLESLERRVRDVDGGVLERRARPPQAQRRPEHVTFVDPEHPGQEQGDQDLQPGSHGRHPDVGQRDGEHVPGLVDGQVDPAQQGYPHAPHERVDAHQGQHRQAGEVPAVRAPPWGLHAPMSACRRRALTPDDPGVGRGRRGRGTGQPVTPWFLRRSGRRRSAGTGAPRRRSRTAPVPPRWTRRETRSHGPRGSSRPAWPAGARRSAAASR